MKNERKIEATGRKISFAQAEEDDLIYWAQRTWQERIIEAERLRRIIWGHQEHFPLVFEKLEGKD